ncbi:hypothetical protein [Pedobacter nyackensis]|uniref:hypothetical protein n=1 Tax=Pedobacter nyackensis TaxID=475255 RepID=UPI00292F3BE5|nr:hypothetical protein [Pedobacter nyackensis]
MKTYISDIIPRLGKYSKELANLTLLAEKHWVALNPLLSQKHMYIFRRNSELLITTDGQVEKGKWELISNDSLLLDVGDSSILFRHGFFDENILALKVDGRNEYAFFVTESKFNSGLNSIESVNEFLKEKYVEKPTVQCVEPKTLTKEELEATFSVTNKQIALIILAILGVFVLVGLLGYLATLV